MNIIQLAKPDDIPSIDVILKNAKSDWSNTILRDCFSESYFNYVFVKDAKITAFLCIRNNIDCWEIMQIVVDPVHHRKHIASQLLQHIIHHAKKNNIRAIQLEVRAKNQAAIALYDKFGFKRVAVRKKYYADGGDALLMDLAYHAFN